MEHTFRPKRANHTAGRAAASPQQRIVQTVFRAFLWGIGASLLMLAAGAGAFAAFPIPSLLVRPAACLIAGVGVAVSGYVLACGIGRFRLLCGLCSGVFYGICLIAASALTGELAWSDSNIALQGVVICSGMLGGTIAALKPARGNR